MVTVTISSKYQVVIPKEIREKLGLRPGQRIRAFVYEGRIELVPVREVRDARGFLPDLDPGISREEDR